MGKLLVQMAFQEMLVKAKTNTSTGLANVPLVLVLAPQQSTISNFFFVPILQDCPLHNKI